MMTENNNPVVMTWFQQQQTPAGWFDLLIIMIEGMLNNAGELESQPFLRQMGASLAETHPLPASETVGDLEANINRLLTHFHWGVVTIDVGGRPAPAPSGVAGQPRRSGARALVQRVLCHTRGVIFSLAAESGRQCPRDTAA